MRILFCTISFDNNQLGRTAALADLCQSAGHEYRVITTTPGPIWSPLANTHFASRCQVVDYQMAVSIATHWADVVVAVKLLPGSFGLGLRLAARRLPLLLDIDDPDFECAWTWRPLTHRIRVLSERPRSTVRSLYLRTLASRVFVITSNPSLYDIYGGEIIPHARPDAGAGSSSRTSSPTVAFVGTNRQHKGVDVLRQAVARLAHQGFRLLITDAPPPDARPWETWCGTTTQEQGMSLVRQADIVALPSLNVGYAPAQLPMKLIDAMIAGRAIVASDLAPNHWALQDTGLLVPPASVGALAEALSALSSSTVRADLGRRARTRALAEFTTEVLAPRLDEALKRATVPDFGLMLPLRGLG